jgi:tetratricopeptide (TPR) repeat protein
MTRLFALTAALALCAAPASAQTMDEAIADFYSDTVPAAGMFLEIAYAQSGNADAWAWVAESYRVGGRGEEGARYARDALALSPCHAMAHTTLAAIHLRAAEPDADSAWAHAARAVECDAADGNAWLAYWDAATLRGDEAAERQAQRRLGELAFFSEPVLELARWTLAAAPPSAVLIAGGDDDYFPLQVAQTAHGVRPDVAIVRMSHLAVPAYVRRVAAATGYPVPPDADDAAGHPPVYRDGPSPLQRAVGSAWVQARLEGGNPRPLALWALADPAFMRGGGTYALLRRDGPVVTVQPFGRLGDPTHDAAAYARAWEDLDVARLNGPLTSAGDRSSIRRNTFHPAELVALLMAGLADYEGHNGRAESARQALGWAERLKETGRVRNDVWEFLDEVRRNVP